MNLFSVDPQECSDDDLAILLHLAKWGSSARTSGMHAWLESSSEFLVHLQELSKITDIMEEYARRPHSHSLFDGCLVMADWWLPGYRFDAWGGRNIVLSRRNTQGALWVIEDRPLLRRYYHAIESLFIAKKLNLQRCGNALHCLLRDCHRGIDSCPKEGCKWLGHTNCNVDKKSPVEDDKLYDQSACGKFPPPIPWTNKPQFQAIVAQRWRDQGLEDATKNLYSISGSRPIDRAQPSGPHLGSNGK